MKDDLRTQVVSETPSPILPGHILAVRCSPRCSRFHQKPNPATSRPPRPAVVRAACRFSFPRLLFFFFCPSRRFFFNLSFHNIRLLHSCPFAPGRERPANSRLSSLPLPTVGCDSSRSAAAPRPASSPHSIPLAPPSSSSSSSPTFSALSSQTRDPFMFLLPLNCLFCLLHRHSS